jgi:hypothetical protein
LALFHEEFDMKKELVLCGVLMFAAVPANAGTLTLALTTASGTQNVSVTIADADVARVLAAGRAYFPQEKKDPPLPPLTDQQVVQAFAKRALAQIIEQTQEYERRKAAANISVPPITVQPQQ